jgi:cytidyltransferase-like protein
MKIGIKSGCWTVLHAGHIFCFQECKKQCDYLIVLTNWDRYILRKKGSVPIPLRDRIYILQSIKYIDEVSFFTQYTEHFWIKDFKENRLYQKFGEDTKLIVFHSSELIGQTQPPGWQFADEIIHIPKYGQSVTQIYTDIRG